ncbi:BTB/POZ domain-containing protein 6-B-like [Amblyomma americanum]
MILALQNDVFRAMFFGHFAREDRLTIMDLHPDGVEGLLRYFYSEQLQVESVHQATCTRSAAVEYMVPELAARCVAYVERYMEPDDVCPFLDYILTMGEDGADGSAKVVLHNNGLFVLASETFESCLHYTANYILDNVHNAPEMSVLQAVHACCSRQCLERGKVGGEPAGLHSVVRPFFLKLRFLVLTVTEFVRGPNVWGMLYAEESLAILCDIIEEDSLPMPADFCTLRTQRV